jgi:predicted phosphate transport protein (TIGR00153 family)
LQGGALLPSTRKEILEISNAIDKIANNVQGISRRMVIERAFFPEEIKPGLLDIASYTRDQLFLLANVVELLNEDYDKLAQYYSTIEEIKAFEKKIDGFERAALKQLFGMDISLAEKIHAKYFITRMEEISDLIEDIADSIQMMVIFRKV